MLENNQQLQYEHNYLPLALNLTNRRVLIVGGGKAAFIKVKSLLDANARPIIVAPFIVDDIQRLVDNGKVRWWSRKFEIDDLKGVRLAVTVTSDKSVNNSVIRAGRVSGVLVVGSGSSGSSGLNFCAAIRRGPLLVSLSTAGGAPSFSRYLKQRFEDLLPVQWKLVAEKMILLRKKIKLSNLTNFQRRLLWNKIFYGSAIEALLDNRVDDYLEEVKECFSSLQE